MIFFPLFRRADMHFFFGGGGGEGIIYKTGL